MLVDVTARWKSAPPQDRLQRRGILLAIAEELRTAAAALALKPNRVRAWDRARVRVRSIKDDIDRARARARTLDRAQKLPSPPEGGSDRLGALDRARVLVRALDRALTSDPDLAVDLLIDLDHALAHAGARESARSHFFWDLDHDLDGTRELAHDLDSAREQARELAHDLDSARELAREPDHDLALVRVLTTDIADILDRTPRRDAASDRESLGPLEHVFTRARIYALTRALARAFDLACALSLDHDLDLGSVFAHQFIEAHDNLIDAANIFLGADLTAVDPSAINLSGVRWDNDTQWPTAEWTARIYRASVENPPGSGVFIVQPGEGHNYAARDPLAPVT
ncbi:hypothetical protein ACWERI_07920 [Streptomyces collinus]